MKAKIILGTIGALILLSGCATSQNVPIPTSKVIPQDTARIQLDRSSYFVSGGRSPAVTDDGVKVGDIGNGGSLIWDRPAGETCVALGKYKRYFNAVGGKLTKLNFHIRDGITLQSFGASRVNKNIIDIND